jgi:hypothetical protein
MVGSLRIEMPVRNASLDPPPQFGSSEAGMHSPAPHRATRNGHQGDRMSHFSEDMDAMHMNDHACKLLLFNPRSFFTNQDTAPHPQPQPQSQRAANQIDALGVHVNEAISTIHRLEGLGLQKLRIPLPKIVVLGK